MNLKVDFSRLPQILRKYREARGLTQKQAAELLGMSEVQYARYEKGQSVLGTPNLQAMVNTFKIPLLEWVTGLSDDELLPVASEFGQDINNYIAYHTRQE